MVVLGFNLSHPFYFLRLPFVSLFGSLSFTENLAPSQGTWWPFCALWHGGMCGHFNREFSCRIYGSFSWLVRFPWNLGNWKNLLPGCEGLAAPALGL